MKKKSILTYILFVVLCLGVGGLATLLTNNQMEAFDALKQPRLSPPSAVFPIVWSILYTLMGISAAAVYLKKPIGVKREHVAFFIQLVLNFLWTILFFGFGLFLIAFFELLALIAAVLIMTVQFAKKERWAGAVQVPYLLWLCFAAYLNLSIYLLNG